MVHEMQRRVAAAVIGWLAALQWSAAEPVQAARRWADQNGAHLADSAPVSAQKHHVIVADETEFVSWARPRAIGLAVPDTTQDRRWTQWLREVVGPARLVALGEPAHGAHEPLAFRNQLFEHLVEELGFTAIALESGFGESQRLWEYVLGAPGDPGVLARSGLTWGFGEFAENVQLLRWIREYNDDPAHQRKVKIYGIDLTGGDGNAFEHARVALDNALAFLSRSAPQLHGEAAAALAPFLTRFTRQGYLGLSSTERHQQRAAINRLLSIFDESRALLIAASSAEKYEWARHNAVSASQLEEFFSSWPPEAPADRVSVEFMDAGIARDASMAANVQWVLDREGPKGRVLLFAHDAHIMNAPLRGGIWNVYPRPLTMMGQRLRASLGERDMLIIATTALENGTGLPARKSGSGSLDHALANVSKPPFLLDIRGEKSKGAAAWLASPRTISANFDTELEFTPAAAFDVIVTLDRLTPAAANTAPKPK